MYAQVKPAIDHSVRGLCVKPYPNHPKGCPNFGKAERCPPSAPLIDEIFDMDKPIYAIYNRFDFGAHVERMRNKHPEWSQRQVECCLYWQGTARKQLKDYINAFLKNYPGLHVLTCPEACGVNVTKTMSSIGVELEWPPQQYTYQVALCGTEILK